jgi:hypothetical protein
LEGPEQERLFLEPEWEKNPVFTRKLSKFLHDRSLHLRHVMMRTNKPIQVLDQIQKKLRQENLQYLTRKVLEDPTESRPVNPPKFTEPENFLYHAELVERLSPWYRDWDILTTSIASLAVRHAYLLGREETNDEDLKILGRVARDSIPVWIARCIHRLAAGPAKPAQLEQEMRLEGSQHEIRRLFDKNMIVWNRKFLRWELNEEHRAGILHLTPSLKRIDWESDTLA